MANYSLSKTRALFDFDASEAKIAKLLTNVAEGPLRKTLSVDQLHYVGERFGFLKRPPQPVVMAVFITKGGVLKTTLTLNLARIAALHNIRTCVVGLDMQGDITTALLPDTFSDAGDNFADAVEKLETVRGLSELMTQPNLLSELVVGTDLPGLSLIPETPELVTLSQFIQMRNRREYWLKELVTDPLKKNFDLILLDCSPNWTPLTTNALVAADALISPLECKIHNFRNLKFFHTLIAEFKRDLQLRFKHCYVPTKFSPGRKLSRDILEWYQNHLTNCNATAIRESLLCEEASALHRSVIEYAPKSPAASEMRQVLKEIWIHVVGRPAVVDRPSPRANEAQL